MSTVQTPNSPRPTASGPSFYRWLILMLGIFLALVLLYRATDSGPQMPARQRLPKMSIIPPFTLTERSGLIIKNSDFDGKV